jgi:hypothetical protein
MRTECVGLNAFLFERRVPEVRPRYECGQAWETVTHVITQCPNLARQRLQLREKLGHDDVRTALSGQDAAVTVRWFMALGRIHQFDLAKRLEETWAAAPRRRGEGEVVKKGKRGTSKRTTL